MRPLTTVAVLCAVAGLGGCVSYAEMRQMPPVATKEIQGSRAVVAACTADELRLNGPLIYVVSDRPDENATRIAAGIPTLLGTPTGSYSWELKISDTAPGVVHAEVRSQKTVWGGFQYPSDLFDIVERCAKPHVTASDSPTKR